MKLPRWVWTVGGSESSESLRADQAIAAALNSSVGRWSHATQDPRTQGPWSRSAVQRAIADGNLQINSKPATASLHLKKGDTVELDLDPPRPTHLIAEEMNLEVLFEDDHIIVINKPPGLSVHASGAEPKGTLVHGLLPRLGALSSIGNEVRPGIVHRLDKFTSGALVVAKTDPAMFGLTQQFGTRTVEREYHALVYGALETDKPLRHESLIARHRTDRKRMSSQVKEGRKAVSNFQLQEVYSVKQGAFSSLIAVRLETGRTHQIRVHLNDLRHSILGDPTYGTPTSRQFKWTQLPQDIQALVTQLPGQALHARTLGFTHPITLQKLRFEARAPELFNALLAQLRTYL